MLRADASAANLGHDEKNAERTGGLVLGVEASLYAIVLVAGFLLRFFALGSQPLGSGEGMRALAAWQLLQGSSPQVWHEPLVELAAGITLFLFGDNDFIARLAPALTGTALIWLVWPLRTLMGRGGALIAAAVLAFSPSFTFYSRFLSGDIFAAALALLLIVLLTDWVQNKRQRSLILAIVALALLLSSGGAALWYLIIFGGYLAAALTLGWLEIDLKNTIRTVISPRRTLPYHVVLFLGTFILAGTGFFLNPAGLGFPALSEWIGQLNPDVSGSPWHYHLLTLVAYEPLALIFGVMGGIYLLRKSIAHTNFHRFLVFWAGLGFILVSLAGEKTSAQLLVVVLPLCLLSGSFLSQLRPTLKKGALRQASYFLIPALILLVFTVIASSFLSNTPRLPSYLWLVSVLSLATVLALIIAAARQGNGQGAHLAILVALGLAFLLNVHITWNLNYRTTLGEWFAPTRTSRDAVRLLQGLGPALEAKERKVVVDARLKDTLGWYLRGKTSVYYVERLLLGESVLIALGDRSPEGAMEGYTKQGRWLRSWWLPEGFSPSGIWRWLMFREVYGPAHSEAIAVYQRK